ncbi:MAG: hypothetical protein KDD56_05745, partial [Bdellovibrionales bacterium]|nr:hypothetical protein [Bdellovibrionales bacterium]
QQSACEGKKRCILLYMAPWCPACRASLPILQSLRRKIPIDSQTGLNIVVGRDRKDSLSDYALSIGGQVSLDINDSVARKYKIQSLPSWLLLDENKRILQNFSGSPSGAPSNEIADFLLYKKFKLKKFLESSVVWK